MNSRTYRIGLLTVACLTIFFCACDTDSKDNKEDPADDDTSPADDDSIDDDNDNNLNDDNDTTIDDDDNDDDDDDDDNDNNDDDDNDNDVMDDDDDDNDDEVWEDPDTGLMWQNGGDVGVVAYNWRQSQRYCRNLIRGDFDDWRLPTIDELRSLVRGCSLTESGGACGVTDDCPGEDCRGDPCSECDFLAGPGPGGVYWPDEITGFYSWYTTTGYRTSTLVTGYTDITWSVAFEKGFVNPVNGYVPVRCVRYSKS